MTRAVARAVVCSLLISQLSSLSSSASTFPDNKGEVLNITIARKLHRIHRLVASIPLRTSNQSGDLDDRLKGVGVIWKWLTVLPVQGPNAALVWKEEHSRLGIGRE